MCSARLDSPQAMHTNAIATPALYEEVAERLRQRIFAHDLPPGTWVDEQALATEFGISRTPMREALKVLASEGLVTLKPRRGCYVTEVSERDLDEIFAIMALLEGQCAGEATRRADAPALDRLAAIHAELERHAIDKDIDAFFDANQAFHRELQQIAGNRWLVQIIEDLRKVLKLQRHDSLFLEGRLQASLDEHAAILSAVAAGDASQAEALMRAHLTQGREAASRRATAS